MITGTAYTDVVSPILTAVIAAEQSDPKLIGRKISPRVPVASTAYQGQIVRENARMWRSLGHGDIESAPGTAFKSVTSRDPDTVAYTVKRYGLFGDALPFEMERRNQLPFSMKERDARLVYRGVELADEKRLATFHQNTSLWTNQTTVAAISGGGGVKWSAAGSTPLVDLRAMRNSIRDRTGQMADTLILDQTTVDALAIHPDVIGAVITQDGLTLNRDRFLSDTSTIAILGRVLGMDPARIFVGQTLASTANEGQSESLGYLWTDTVVMGCFLGGNALASQATIYATPVAALGIDEYGVLDGIEPGLAAMTGGFMAGEYIDQKAMAWQSRVWHYSTEAALLPNLVQLATDAV